MTRDAEGITEITLPPWASSPRFDLTILIDHTLLKPEATANQVARHCEEAARDGFASVCVNPIWVPLAAATLRGSGVRVCTVAGFPLGATPAKQKAGESASALEDGADEVDTVLPIGLVLGDDWGGLESELRLLRKAVPKGSGILKVILETCLLNEAQKIRACLTARDAGVDFVKTSTGFSTGGATEADVRLLRKTVGAFCGVKASGGIRTYEEAFRMVLAGATRLGLSASIAVTRGSGASTSGY